MTLIITICSLLLIAYIFDLTSSRTRIPSVILLLALGWAVKQLSIFLGIQIPDLTSLLPIFGTIGLILIVLEGSLELEINKNKFSLIKKSILVSIIPIIALVTGVAYALQYYGGGSLKTCVINAIPFCVISSAIAIPSVAHLSKHNKEFIIYESSLSDIFGVIFFNFVALNAVIDLSTFGNFGLDLLLICVISFIATVGLSVLLSKIDHHIKFAPIIILVILIYAVSKQYHLPALIFIMLFGLFLGNLDELKGFKWTKNIDLENLKNEVSRFKEIVVEGAFLIRTLFFLLFGYLIETSEILNTETFVWAIGIVAGIFFIRMIILLVSRLPLTPLLFIAPRGLITILLFFSIIPSQQLPLVNKSVIIQVIILTAIIMMFGLMASKRDKTGKDKKRKSILNGNLQK